MRRLALPAPGAPLSGWRRPPPGHAALQRLRTALPSALGTLREIRSSVTLPTFQRDPVSGHGFTCRQQNSGQSHGASLSCWLHGPGVRAGQPLGVAGKVHAARQRDGQWLGLRGLEPGTQPLLRHVLQDSGQAASPL